MKRGINGNQARHLLFKYYITKLGEVLVWADSNDIGGGNPKL